MEPITLSFLIISNLISYGLHAYHLSKNKKQIELCNATVTFHILPDSCDEEN